MIAGMIVPGDSSNNTTRNAVYGPGVSIGGGLEILLNRWLMLDIGITQDIVYLLKKTQSITPAGATEPAEVTVVKGGIDPQFGVMISIGAHF